MIHAADIHTRKANAYSASAAVQISKAKQCRDFIARKGYRMTPTVQGIIAQHIWNARRDSRHAMHYYRLAGRYE